jgi:hypothetical protein
MFVQPPVGATHAAVEVAVDAGYGFQVDDISISYSTSIHFDDRGLNFSGRRFLHHNLDEGVIGKFLSAVAHLHPPFTIPTVARTNDGNLQAGNVFYQVAFYDHDGITTLGGSTTPVSIGGMYWGASLTNIPIGPHGTVGRALFRQYVGDSSLTYRIDIPNNTATSYIDYGVGDDPEKDSTLPTVNTTLARPVMPRRAVIFWNTARCIPGKSIAVTAYSSNPWCFYVDMGSPTAGDWMEDNVWLEAGTYTIKTLGVTGNTRGNVDYLIDGVEVISDQNWYAGTAAANVVKTATGIVVPSSGYHTVRLVFAARPYLTATWFDPGGGD